METTFIPALNTTTPVATYTDYTARPSLWARFMAFCKGQEQNRLLWLGIILAAHGCILTPVAVMVTLMAGPNFFLFMTAMVAMGIALVTNLAAKPTKVTIPTFALSVLIDVVVVISALALALA